MNQTSGRLVEAFGRGDLRSFLIFYLEGDTVDITEFAKQAESSSEISPVGQVHQRPILLENHGQKEILYFFENHLKKYSRMETKNGRFMYTITQRYVEMLRKKWNM